MKKRLQLWLEAIWYHRHVSGILLRPLGALFLCIVALRRFLYRKGILKSTTLPVPVIIVGNLTVGGTGKTPLIIYLAELLRQAGYKPGIISRGYGGQSEQWPRSVTADSSAIEVGDESVLLADRTGCPLAVGPSRIQAAEMLLSVNDCDILLSDDGLQHYAMARTLEIVVIDGARRFGNGLCLPAGPLREPLTRLSNVDLRVVNGAAANNKEFAMQVKALAAINLNTGEQRPLSTFKHQACHAVAGIGNPQRFFTVLAAEDIVFTEDIFSDHHRFAASDLQFQDTLPVLMTEKDAVKCKTFAAANHWYVPIIMEPVAGFNEHFLTLLQEKLNGYKFA